MGQNNQIIAAKIVQSAAVAKIAPARSLGGARKTNIHFE